MVKFCPGDPCGNIYFVEKRDRRFCTGASLCKSQSQYIHPEIPSDFKQLQRIEKRVWSIFYIFTPV